MNKKENYPEHSSSVNNEIASREQKYLEENLRYYIQKNATQDRTSLNISGWCIKTDHETRMRIMLSEYILDHFTLWDLYTIFYENQECFILEKEIIRESKQTAIESINGDESLSQQEKKQLKRKVWDMNPILFGLIKDFIQYSDLFFDEDTGELVFPHFERYYEIA
jgi:hypothetical protein